MSQQMTLESRLVGSVRRGMGTPIWELFFLQDPQWVFGDKDNRYGASLEG